MGTGSTFSSTGRQVGQTRRYGVALLGVMSVAVLLVPGCGAVREGRAGDSIVEYAEPQWMTQKRQREEEHILALGSCFREGGWELDIRPDGSYSAPDGMTEPQEPVFRSIERECLLSLAGPDDNYSDEYWHAAYSHALDTRECLAGQGYVVGDAPNEDIWIEQGKRGKAQWAPFQGIVDDILYGRTEMSSIEFYALYNQCPQDTPNVSISFQ
jgi:hypothetical protein